MMNKIPLNQEDHDLLIRLETKVDALTEKVTELTNNTAKQLADHETRIRRLERWGFIAIGGIAIIETILRFWK